MRFFHPIFDKFLAQTHVKPYQNGAMLNKITINMAQLEQKMGDVAHNAQMMLRARHAALSCDLIIFPELQLIGYPPEDLVLKPALVSAAKEQLTAMASETRGNGPAMLVGTVHKQGEQLYNAMALLDKGEIQAIICKHELPNYGTFDEKRLFAKAPLQPLIACRGFKIGVPICEDIWYPKVAAHYKAKGADFLIIPNGSPYEQGKKAVRNDVIAQRVRETGLPMLYINRVGAQDELAFDGASFVMNEQGKITHQLRDWEEGMANVVITREKSGKAAQIIPGNIATLCDYPENLWQAMVTALRDYVDKNGFPGVILGLSGGINSALSAAIAVDALGADRVWCVMMPSRYTSKESLEDAAQCAEMLGCRLDTIPINDAVIAFDGMLDDIFADKQPDTTEENIQSRIRGVTLMALSNKFGHMLLTTGNKSEMAVGYATIYGDMAGGYNVLKDMWKTTCFQISRWRNANLPKNVKGKLGPVMPERIITKPPSAELRDDQRDDDSLPPYEVLDPILIGLVEEELSVQDLAKRGFNPQMVARIEKLLYIAEYKRNQAPPGVKLTPRNFGRDRRYPITNFFRTAQK